MKSLMLLLTLFIAPALHAQVMQTSCYVPVNSSVNIVMPSGHIQTGDIPTGMAVCPNVKACRVRFGPGAFNLFPGGEVYYGDVSGLLGCTLQQIANFTSQATVTAGEQSYTALGTPFDVDVMTRAAVIQVVNSTSFTIGAGYSAQVKVILMCRAGVIGQELTPPSNIKGLDPLGNALCSSQSFTYYLSLGCWRANGPAQLTFQ